MEKPCKECPWVVRNKNNDTIIIHSKKWNKKHNCHMKIKNFGITSLSSDVMVMKIYYRIS